MQAARNLRDAGLLYARPLAEKPLIPQEYTIRPPLYPLFLLLTGGAGPGFPLATLLLQNLLSLLNLGLALRWLARRVGALSSRQWSVMLALAAAAPGQFIYANVLMSEILLQTTVVVLWLSLEALFASTINRRILGPLLLAAFATIGTLLNKPVFFPFAFVLLGLGLWLAWQQRRVSLAALGAVPLVVVGFWMTRNEARTGYFHFSSIAEINLLRYNVRGVLQATEGPAAAEQFVRTTLATADSLPTFRAQQRYVRQVALRALLRHPFAYAGQHLRGTATFLLDPGRFDVVQFCGLNNAQGPGFLRLFNQRKGPAVLAYLRQLPLGLLAAMGMGLLANLLRLGLVVRFARARVYPLSARLVLLGLVAYVALLTGPLGAARFVVPVLPLLLAAAGAGLAARRTTRREALPK